MLALLFPLSHKYHATRMVKQTIAITPTTTPAIAPPDNPPRPELELEVELAAGAGADAVGFVVVWAEVLLATALVPDEAAALTTTPFSSRCTVLVPNGVAAVAVPVVIRF